MFDGVEGTRLQKAALVAVVLLAVFLGVKAVAELQAMRYIGAGIQPTNTISISGYGEELAVPDIATFSFSVVSEKSTVAAAQEDATTKVNDITTYLKGAGIAEKDIKTSNYSVYPQYDYVQQPCPVGSLCPSGRQQLRGYEVRQTTTVKVRDTARAGDLLTGVGSRGATEVSGLNFTFDDPDAVEAAARDKAIADAESKAKELARSLGVRLVRVVNFYETSYGGPKPYYALDAAMGTGGSTAEARPAVAPDISVGENTVTSNVSITYEIK